MSLVPNNHPVYACSVHYGCPVHLRSIVSALGVVQCTEDIVSALGVHHQCTGGCTAQEDISSVHWRCSTTILKSSSAPMISSQRSEYPQCTALLLNARYTG